MNRNVTRMVTAPTGPARRRTLTPAAKFGGVE
jgi:hypothetical protein